MKTYKVAFIGCGRIACLHADGYKGNPQCKIVALADVKADAAKGLAEKYGYADAKIFSDYKKMIREIRPDIVSICLWTGLHAEVVKYCVRAKVPAIHCEKPMAPSWSEALSMARAVEKSRTQLTFNHQRRKLPVFLKARELLRKGAIGKLQRIEAFNPQNILDWGTHVVDMCFNMNGDKPAVRVLGQVDARPGGAWFGIPFEKSAIGRITFANGVTAVIQSGDDKEMVLGFRLIGTDGEIEILEEKPHLRVRAKGKPSLQPLKIAGHLHGVETNEHIHAVIKDVTDGLSGRRKPELSMKNALRATEVIYAWYESALKRQAVELPLKPGAANYPALAKAAGIKPGK